MILAPVPPTVNRGLHGPVVTLLLANRPPTPTLPTETNDEPASGPAPRRGGKRSVRVTARSLFVTGHPGPLQLTCLADVAAVVAANHEFWCGDTEEAGSTAARHRRPASAPEATSLVGVEERVDIPLEPDPGGREPDPLDAAMAGLERRRLPYQVVAVQGAPRPGPTGRNGSTGAPDLAFLDRIGLLVRLHLAPAAARASFGVSPCPGDPEGRGPWLRARIVRGGDVVELITTRRPPRTLAPVEADGLDRAVENVLGSLAVGEVGVRTP